MRSFLFLFVLVCDTAETSEPDSHHIPPHDFYNNHRPHVQLLQGLLWRHHGDERDCPLGSDHVFHQENISITWRVNIPCLLVWTPISPTPPTSRWSTAGRSSVSSFVDTLVQTYIHTLREAPVSKAQAWKKNQKTRKIDFWKIFVRVVYPVFFLVVILIFWLVGLIYYIVP